MSPPIISAENLSKRYRLGVIGATTLRESFERWWHRTRGRDPDAEMGVVGPATNWRPSSSSKSPRSGDVETAELWALRDVSFEVQRGEVLGIIGRIPPTVHTLLIHQWNNGRN